jgi:hypothetical protein
MMNVTNDTIAAAIYAACLASAKAMGGDINGLSWFGKNVPREVRKAA